MKAGDTIMSDGEIYNVCARAMNECDDTEEIKHWRAKQALVATQAKISLNARTGEQGTILELPDKLPGWASLKEDGIKLASFWTEDIDIGLAMHSGWFIAIWGYGQIQAFTWVDTIRRE